MSSRDIDFIGRLNESLENLESELFYDGTLDNYSNVFILGLPRSGTTLISQILFNNLDVETINNLTARFWKTPLCGIQLSKTVLGKSENADYSSNYGRTQAINSPHEFSYFWKEKLKIEDRIQQENKNEVTKSVDWNHLAQYLRNFNAMYKKPMVFKTLEYTAYYMEEFLKYFPKSVYVFIDRDKLDLAKSIYLAWLNSDTDHTGWWSSIPLNYNIKDDSKSVVDKVVDQIYYLNEMYTRVLAQIPKEFLFRINYQDLCKDPAKFLNDFSGFSGIPCLTIPDPFKLKNKSFDPNIEVQLKQRLEAKGLI